MIIEIQFNDNEGYCDINGTDLDIFKRIEYNKALDDVIKELSSLECCGYVECKFEDIKDKIEELRKEVEK